MNETQPFLLTKILATLGPASADVPTLLKLIDEGVRMIRINFSHGTLDDFSKTLAVARAAAEESGIDIGILGDLSGPKIRVTTIKDGCIDLKPGDQVEFTKRDIEAYRDPETGVVTIGTTFPEMVDEVVPGERLLVNDGAIRMLVTDRVTPEDAIERIPEDPRLICNVTVGGPLTNKKGVNLPDTELTVPAMTEWDAQCAEWAVDNGLDFLALSFVRKGEDIAQLKALLRELGRDNRDLRSHSRLPIIAKIEKPQAVEALADILEEADGVMVARGDLGVEMENSEVPILQKRIIQTAHDHGKPVIVATQMLESMIQNAVATRAEVSDVANAILDGTDAVMLSGETAVGAYPVQAVNTMGRTAAVTELYEGETRLEETRPPKLPRESRYRTAALAHGVSVIVKDIHAKYVVVWSELGGGAQMMSQNRLHIPILAVSSNHSALRHMSILRGVQPVYMERPKTATDFLESMDKMLRERGWANEGDAIVLVDGEPLGTPGVTNNIRIHYVGDVCRLRWHPKEED